MSNHIEHEIQNLLSSIKMQVKAYSEETVRLKNYLDQVIKDRTENANTQDEIRKLQEEFFLQTNQIASLKRDNEQMAQGVKIMEDQNISLKVWGSFFPPLIFCLLKLTLFCRKRVMKWKPNARKRLLI